MKKLIMAQLGARRHYAVPVMLNSIGALCLIYTDLYISSRMVRFLELISRFTGLKVLKKISGRHSEYIEDSCVKYNFKLAVKYYLLRKFSRKSQDDIYNNINKEFCLSLGHEDLKCSDGVYTFNPAGLEIMQKAKEMNKICIMEQTIAPKIYESELLFSEYKKYGAWVDDHIKIHKNIEFENREREEWKLADSIICGSDFVKDLLIKYGVEKAKCLVIPSGVKINISKDDKLLYNGERKLRVLTVGTVNLRKGIQYTYQAAKKLEHIAEFRCVGKIELNNSAKHDISTFIDLVGEVPRSEISEHYKWADVFLLPSLCEGSALSVYEALSFQLPVICTYSTGSIIKNGVGGIIIPSHDASAIVDSIISLTNVDRYIALHSGINDIVEEASFESYQARWSEHMSSVLKEVEDDD